MSVSTVKINLKLALLAPYLTPIDADEIRAQVAEMKPRMHLVKDKWPWLEVRGIRQEHAKEIMEWLSARQIRFNEIKPPKTVKAKVQVAEVNTVD